MEIRFTERQADKSKGILVNQSRLGLIKWNQWLYKLCWLSQFMAHPLIKYRAAIKREDSLSDVEDLQGVLSKKK